MRTESILIDRASTHNLKQISLAIPKRAITVVTGLSGSGKSSLVFSTLAAESQRMINRSYSSYIQQLLPKYEPAEVARIDNLPFSIVVTQKQLSGNARSTVGTYTDIHTALRLLFSRMARPFIGYSMTYSFNNPAGMCPTCQGLGTVRSLLLDRLLNMDLSLNQGAINFPTFQPGGWRLTRYTDSGYFDNDLPLREWASGDLDFLLYGKKQNRHTLAPTGTRRPCMRDWCAGSPRPSSTRTTTNTSMSWNRLHKSPSAPTAKGPGSTPRCTQPRSTD